LKGLFKGLSMAIKAMKIIEELIEIWLNEVCNTPLVLQRLRLWQVDFVSVFLNSNSNFKVFIEQPKGFEKKGEDKV